MAATGRAGYEYNYQFSVNDELVRRDTNTLVPGGKNFIFEITTMFIMKKTDSEDEIMGSERYMAEVILVDVINGGVSLHCGFHIGVSDRLIKDYWMTEEDYSMLEDELIEFARQTEADPSRAHCSVVPIAIDLKVCTVQRDGERVELALERAIRAEKLIPLYLFPFLIGLLENEVLPPNLFSDIFWYFLSQLERIRVENAGEGLPMMRDCGVCLRAPVWGDQISVLAACGHAFHSHCIVGRLLFEKRECPLCRCCAVVW